jgi:hypothetical protein
VGFQPRLIDAIEELLRREADAGWLDLPAVVRLIESYTYWDLIRTGTARRVARRADPEDAPALSQHP